MRRSNLRGKNAWSVSLALGALLLSPLAIVAQGNGAPKVGGTSTFDSPGAGDTDNPNGRHRMTTLTSIPEDFSNLKLSPGFLLGMEVYDAPELSSDVRIDTLGNINVPMVGAVHVADKTLTEATVLIEQSLKDGKILNNPQVNLNITQYAGQNVSILGEVHNPGRVELLASHNLEDVIALAGGETQLAGNMIEIRHPAGVSPQKELIHYSRSSDDMTLVDTQVHPGDTVTIRRAGIVYVLGAVTRPGGYIMQEGGELNLTEALSMAYGTTLNAAVGSMRLIRKLPDGQVQETPIAYRDIEKGKIPPVRLQAEDLIYVPVSKVKTIVSTGLLASTSQAALYVYH
ncbi:polysaccharide biosynthesis/export family protein [Granulicella sp. S190]|uniref:polysaccharide biosynthesis/export family protein n=1 Tax=Granulicella sp. S190 TaxID=1747226 RepID=UPI00131E6FAB|nr:polysaccharide biosynthesis/export family protein [Granulicella sp. S190]